jgi:type I restriction enzyme M protein
VSQQPGFSDKVAFIWSCAELLRGDVKAHEYGQYVLPFLVLRRLECALEPTKAAVIAKAAGLDPNAPGSDKILRKIAGHGFYNTSPLDLTKLLNDPGNVAANMRTYVAGFSADVREVLEAYRFDERITNLDKADLLYKFVSKFAELDLSEGAVTNREVGLMFEELLRRFSEMSNETAGEHFTPREVIRLMVNILFAEDDAALSGAKPIRTMYDPACGTGGMLSIAQEHLHELNPNAVLEVYGQELNPETWAIARSDFMIQGQDPERIALGNSLTDTDGHSGETFDYMLANPPFGVDWSKYKEQIEKERDALGLSGRYGQGLPRVSDGSLLFLLHMLSKMKPVDDDPTTPNIIEGGSRLAIVFSGSPLFSGAAEGGESEIRRWIIENDLLEGIVALPDQLFYNTGISTYFWILTNRKPKERQGKIALVDARDSFTKMRKSLGEKRKTITDEQIAEITTCYRDALDAASSDKRVKIFDREAFGFQRITVERPLHRAWRVGDDLVFDEKTAKNLIDAANPDADAKTLKTLLKDAATTDPSAPVATDKKGNPQADADLRDQENIPLPAGYLSLPVSQRTAALVKQANEYLEAEIKPYAADAWIDHDKTKIGYEIPFTRHFYEYIPPRPLAEIDAELIETEKKIQELLAGLLR